MNTKQRYGLKDLEKEYDLLTFGEALESYRLGEEIRQTDMAKRIGISAQSLCDIEKGRRTPTPKRAAKIAQVIGEPQIFWIKPALQDGLRKEDLKFDVFLKPSVDPVKATHFDQTDS